MVGQVGAPSPKYWGLDEKQPSGSIADFQGPPAGLDQPSTSKLTSQEIQDIRNRHAQGGIGYGRLAKLYEVDKRTIAQIIKGDIWRESDTKPRGSACRRYW
jgi:hypothetical protein